MCNFNREISFKSKLQKRAQNRNNSSSPTVTTHKTHRKEKQCNTQKVRTIEVMIQTDKNSTRPYFKVPWYQVSFYPISHNKSYFTQKWFKADLVQLACFCPVIKRHGEMGKEIKELCTLNSTVPTSNQLFFFPCYLCLMSHLKQHPIRFYCLRYKKHYPNYR